MRGPGVRTAPRLALEQLEDRWVPATFYVATTGSDVAVRTPRRTRGRRCSTRPTRCTPGDTVDVRGHLRRVLAHDRRLVGGDAVTFRADPGTVITTIAPVTVNSGVESGIAVGWGNNVPSYVTIDGFASRRPGASGHRHPLPATDHPPVARPDPHTTWPTAPGGGLGHARQVRDLLGLAGLPLEANNVVTGTYNSLIYTANSSNDYAIRGNDVSNGGGNGIHNNGDGTAGGAGVNLRAVIENT